MAPVLETLKLQAEAYHPINYAFFFPLQVTAWQGVRRHKFHFMQQIYSLKNVANILKLFARLQAFIPLGCATVLSKVKVYKFSTECQLRKTVYISQSLCKYQALKNVLQICCLSTSEKTMQAKITSARALSKY